MRKLSLHFNKPIQGKFSLEKLNFLFVFQVNCPGCFFYGIPMVNDLYAKYNKHISFLGLSTAFEDYDFNTEGNTSKLLTNGTIVGETKKAFAKHNHPNYPTSINFPIAFDEFADETFDYNKASKIICQLNPNYQIWPSFEKIELQQKVKLYLKNLSHISKTFTLNQLKGTPTFIIFNNDYEVLLEEFGHIEFPILNDKIKNILQKEQ